MRTLIALSCVVLTTAAASAITWDFDTNGDAQGWLAQDVPVGRALGTTHAPLRSTVTDGIWRIEAGPFVEDRRPTVGLMSTPLGLPSELFDRIEIRCRVVHHSPIKGQLTVVWTNEHNRWDAPLSNLIDYSYYVTVEQVYTGQWQELTVSLLSPGQSYHPVRWAGQLEEFQVRLVLGEPTVPGGVAWAGGAEDVPEAVEIDWIRLTGISEQLNGELPPPVVTEDTPFGRLFAPAVFNALTDMRVVGYSNGQQGALGDLDEDGDLDLVAPWESHPGDGGWLTATNTGDGAFAQAGRLVATNDTRVIGIDMDQDGRMDVVSVGPTYRDVSYYRNDPRLGWVKQQEISGSVLLGVGDLEGDGDPDLWLGENLSEADETLWVHRMGPSGTLEPPISLGHDLLNRGLHPGCTVNAWGPSGQRLQYWWSRTGDAVVYWDESLTPVVKSQPSPDGYQVYVGDLDLDGDVDEVYTEAQGFDQIPLWKGMRIALNNGDGTAETLVWEQDVDLTGGVRFVELSGDGRPDMVFVDSDVRQPAVIICLGVDEGLPIQEGRYPIAGRGGPILTGDVDKDGDIDLVVLERSVNGNGGVHVLLNRMGDRVTAVTDDVARADAGSSARHAGATLPTGLQLHPAYPNPFNPETVIPFTLPQAVQSVRLRIYNLMGQPVRTLMEGALGAGTHRVMWDGLDDRGRRLPSGVYLCRLSADAHLAYGRVVRVE